MNIVRVSDVSRPAVSLALTVTVFLVGFGWSGSVAAEPEAQSAVKDSIHSHRWRLRGSAWFAMLDGDFETRNRFGNKVSLDLSSDLDYDEPYITPQFEGGFRYNKHDFWVVATLLDEGEKAVLPFSFDFDDVTIPVNVPFTSDVEFTDINFRYGYAFRTIEDHGYRLGPYVGVSYTDFEFKGGVRNRPALQDSYDDTFPIPTFGAYTEIPWDKTLIAASIGGIWFESGDFEGIGIRGELSATYRFHENVGLFAGLYAMYIDLDLKKQDINDLILWGPNVGLELRF